MSRKILPHGGACGAERWNAASAELAGKAEQIGEDRADLVFEVRIDINDANGQLLAGMPADIYFEKP